MEHNLTPVYPDVLGSITGGIRTSYGELECAVGIYPRMAYLHQPAEVVVILQSLVDQPITVRIGLRAPTTDRDDNVVIIDVSRHNVELKLQPAEVGVLRLPVVPRPPTRAVADLPFRVKIRHQVPPSARIVRPPGIGPPPNVVSVSPFKLQVLRDVTFFPQKSSNDPRRVLLSLVSKGFPGNPNIPRSRYEVLWSVSHIEKELELVNSQLDLAREYAQPGVSLFEPLLEQVKERFAARSMPLHPGEADAIARIMTYTIEDAPYREPNVIMENTRWFRSIGQLFANDPTTHDIDRPVLFSRYLFDAVLHEAVVLAFDILEHLVKEDLGTTSERLHYANRLVSWLNGMGEPDLNYIYLPLVLGGVAIARFITTRQNPWVFADQLEEAYFGRNRLVTGETVVVMEMLLPLLDQYRGKLRAQRIQRD